MIFEMRTYRLQPGSVPEAEKRFGEALTERVKVSPLGAFFHTEVGPLNHIIHIWPYDDLQHRTRVRSQSIPNWPPKIQEFIVEMESKICQRRAILPGLHAAPARQSLRDPDLYDAAGIGAGGRREMGRADRGPGQAVAAGRSRLYRARPDLNQWIHIWAYKDANERARIREESRKDGTWPPATRGLFVKQENQLVVPASFSPLH